MVLTIVEDNGESITTVGKRSLVIRRVELSWENVPSFGERQYFTSRHLAKFNDSFLG